MFVSDSFGIGLIYFISGDGTLDYTACEWYLWFQESSSVKGNQHTKRSGHVGLFFQTELMAEIYSKSPVRPNGEVLLMKFS